MRPIAQHWIVPRVQRMLNTVVISGLVASCASPPVTALPPVQGAMEIKQIMGTWEGYGGDRSRYTMTIAGDGTFRRVGIDREFVGRVQVSEGQFRWNSKTTGRSGTFVLHESDRTRILEMRIDDGSVTGQYTPAHQARDTAAPISINAKNASEDGNAERKSCAEATHSDARSYGPPKYCVGDTWTFSFGGVQTVVKVENDTIIMTGTTTPGISCPGCLVTFDSYLALRSIAGADGRPLEVSRDYIPLGDGWRYWDFPLTVGKTWGFSGKGFAWGLLGGVKLYTARCKVEAYENVTVRAGIFKAFKISRTWNRYQVNVESTDYSDMLWFAPEVKTTVKFASLPLGKSWELVSYSLK
jgi:hypothetical protein